MRELGEMVRDAREADGTMRRRNVKKRKILSSSEKFGGGGRWQWVRAWVGFNTEDATIRLRSNTKCNAQRETRRNGARRGELDACGTCLGCVCGVRVACVWRGSMWYARQREVRVLRFVCNGNYQ